MACHDFRSYHLFPALATARPEPSVQSPSRPGVGGPGAPLASHVAQVRAAPPRGARPWTIQRRDTRDSEIIDAAGNCFLIDTHAKVAEIAARVNEAGL